MPPTGIPSTDTILLQSVPELEMITSSAIISSVTENSLSTAVSPTLSANTHRWRLAATPLFMDPDPEQIRLAKKIGADRVELYTESYAASCGTFENDAILERFAAAAKAAHDVGLGVNAGHDLSLTNLEKLLVACEHIAEVSIGHALVSEALEYGMTETVGRYNGICLSAYEQIEAKKKGA